MGVTSDIAGTAFPAQPHLIGGAAVAGRAVRSPAHPPAMAGAPAGRRWMRWLILLAIPLATLAMLGARLVSRAPTAATGLPTVRAREGTLTVDVEEVGRIEPRTRAQIRSRVGGLVTHVHVREGEMVTEGQLLISLDPLPFSRQIDGLRAEVVEQQALLEVARKTLGRTRGAIRARVAPSSEMDHAQGDARLAAARLLKAQIALQSASDERRYTWIRAPFSGAVIQRNVNAGETVMAGVSGTGEGRPLLVIADLGTLLVKIDVNQIDVAKIALGQRSTVTIDAFAGEPLTARVTQIASASTPGPSGSEVFQVELTLDPTERLARVKPGMTADVSIHVEEGKTGVIIPVEAVVKEGGRDYVDVITDVQGTTERRSIVVGESNPREVLVRAGLAAGEQVSIAQPAPVAKKE